MISVTLIKGGKHAWRSQAWSGTTPGRGEGRVVRVSLSKEAWTRVEEALSWMDLPRSRALGQLLLLGVEERERASLPWWKRVLRCLRRGA